MNIKESLLKLEYQLSFFFFPFFMFFLNQNPMAVECARLEVIVDSGSD